MGIIQYQLQYGPTFATATTVATNVQSVSINAGRQRPLDQYNANTATVVLRYPTGYASPNPSFVTDTWVRILVRRDTDAYKQIFTGRISDVQVQYGIPYQSGVGNADYVTLSLEGNFAAWGRMSGNNYVMAADIFNTQINVANGVTGLKGGVISGYGSQTPFPSTTISGTWGDWINKCVLTMNGRLIDTGDIIVVANQYYKIPAVYGGFSDTTNDAENHIYEQIQFASYADNYYTQVTVSPESYTAQTVQQGVIPYRTYTVNTFNNSTGQALDYANYLLSTYGTRAVRIESVTCNLNAQNGDIPGYGVGSIGTEITVQFRGQLFRCVIEGMTFSGTPASASVTFYFSAQDLNNYLILNDAVYGKLDSNKLGY